MSRTAPDILNSLIGKLPRGFALAKRGGNFDEILNAIAKSLADFEASLERLINEIDPRTAIDFLPDFERVLGPDPCGRDLDNPTISQRQKLAHQRWTTSGGQSIPYLIDVAKKLGVDIEIEEFWPTQAGQMQAGQELIPDGEQFVWRVKLTLNGYEKFVSGDGQAGDPLGSFITSGIECELRRIAHAHTTVVFSYLPLEEAA